MMKMPNYKCIALLALLPSLGVADSLDDLLDLSLEDLMSMKVSSVMKRQESLATSKAAVFVVTAEDILRSGATTIPDALRMVPGMNIAQIDTNKWAVTARGFNSRFANKLLIMIDGRTIYSTIFSGVLWENQDLLLSDIDRIEVVRGPGATLWGSNAVNGVINIITKNAEETQGPAARAYASTNDERILSLRYGGKIDQDTAYRVYAKGHRAGELKRVDSSIDSHDEMDLSRVGFRLDRTVDSNTQLTFQGEAFRSDIEQTGYDQLPLSPTYHDYVNDPIDQYGMNILGRWLETTSSGGRLTTQLFYDMVDREEDFLDIRQKLYDLDIQYEFPVMGNHRLIAGGGYRQERHYTKPTPYLIHHPDNSVDEIFNLFVQDEMRFMDDRLSVVIGSKFEKNPFSDKEVDAQPSVRLGYQLSNDHYLWAAVSRALRTFSRAEQQSEILVGAVPLSYFTGPQTPPGMENLPLLLIGEGQNNHKTEKLDAYEMGYRGRLSENMSLDVALFYNEYDDLRSHVQGLPEFMCPSLAGVLVNCFDFVPPAFPIGPPVYAQAVGERANLSDARSHGVEVVLDWKVTDNWRLKGAYSYIDIDEGIIEDGVTYEVPRHNISLRSLYDLGNGRTFDLWYRFVDDTKTPGIDFTQPIHTDKYTSLDFRYGWQITPRIQAALIGKNLLDNHREFSNEFSVNPLMEVKRSFALELIYNF